MQNETLSSDTLLQPFLRARDAMGTAHCLDQLIAKQADPILTGIIAGKFGLSLRHRNGRTQTQAEQDAEDVRGTVHADLIKRLYDLKNDANAKPIGHFDAFVAHVSFHAIHRYLRKKYPRRHQLQDQLRSLLSCQQGLAIWPDVRAELICGFAVWQEQGHRAHPSERLEQLTNDPQTSAQTALPQEDARQVDLAVLVAGLLNWVGHPVTLQVLVRVVAALRGIQEEPTSHLDGELTLVHPADVQAAASQRAFLRQIWQRLHQLPRRQCAALLLNLRAVDGNSIALYLTLAGITTPQGIAELLGFSMEAFRELWGELPLNDAAIAALLGTSRQTVFNHRYAARKTLAQRLR